LTARKRACKANNNLRVPPAVFCIRPSKLEFLSKETNVDLYMRFSMPPTAKTIGAAPPMVMRAVAERMVNSDGERPHGS
jgi:hypothetical protein